MKSRIVCLVLLLLAAVGALALRLPGLGQRPMHADEAVQAAIFRQLWQQGRYVYDPDEFHGPTLQYATLPAVWIGSPKSFAQTSEATFRIVPVVFGTCLILLLWPLLGALGKPAAVCAAVLTAISPAMVFYSRYYIHETLLVFFTLGAIATAWTYLRSGKLAWCLAAGTSLGLMQATKETSAIAYFAMAVALLCTRLWGRLLGEASPENRPSRPAWHLAAGLAVAVLVAVVLLSSFFANLRGPIDGVLTYGSWLSRAGGASPHAHPWYYYLRVLAFWRVGDGPLCSEGLILALAAVGFGAGLLPRGTGRQGRQPIGAAAPPAMARSRWSLRFVESFAIFDVSGAVASGSSAAFVRTVGFYTLALTAAYSVIPYKTPWCLLGFLQPMILLAGVGAVALVRIVPTIPLKSLTASVILCAACHLAWQSYRASFVLPADPGNPYVYAHTLPDVVRLSDDVEELVKATADGEPAAIKVIWHDAYYWPLPWYLRRFAGVEYRTRMPDDPAAALVISSVQLDAALRERLDATHLMSGYYGVRPNVLAELWVRLDVWEAHLRRTGRL